MYAVIRTGGKQYRVAVGDWVDIEKLPADVGEEVAFDEVLLVADDSDVRIGTPLVEGVRVVGTVVAQERGRKILVYKYKRRKNYRRRRGHRQPFTRVRIDAIGAATSPAATPPPPPVQPPPAGGPPPPPPEAFGGGNA